jgi:hypothetical protein
MSRSFLTLVFFAVVAAASPGFAQSGSMSLPVMPHLVPPIILNPDLEGKRATEAPKPIQKGARHPTEQFSVAAFPPPGTPPSDAICAAVARESSWEVRDRLRNFETVYGKPSIRWTTDDFERLIGVARSCNAFPVGGGGFIDGSNWTSMILNAFDSVMPVAQLAAKVDAYGASLGALEAKLPSCQALLDYVKDDWALTDNSAAVFGVDFMRLKDDDLDKVTRYVNECLVYLPDYALAAKGVRQNDSTALLDAVMDRALLIVKRRADYAVWPRSNYDIHLVRDGVEIVPTFSSALAREMVQWYDRLAASGRRFTPEMVATMIRLADDVESQRKSAFDIDFAQIVRQRVQDMIFRKGE